MIRTKSPARFFIFSTLLLCAASMFGQGTRADYERANQLRNRFKGKVFKTRVEPHWFAGGSCFWYRNDLKGGRREFILVDAVKRTRAPAFDHTRLAISLSKVLNKQCKPDMLPIDKIEFIEDGKSFQFKAGGKGWKCDLKTYRITKSSMSAATQPGAKQKETRRRSRKHWSNSRRDSKSPDGKWSVFAKNNDLFLRDVANKKEFRLTTDGKKDNAYDPRVLWSPDCTRFVSLRTKTFPERIIYMVESSPRDQLQPKLHSLKYRKPGDEIPLARPHLFCVETKKHIAVKTDLFPIPWSLTQLRWAPDSSRFTFLYNQRGHQVLRIIAVDAKTGKARTIINEKSKTFIDYAYKQFSYYLDNSNEIIWMSERDGWNHLYLFDALTGKIKNQVTSGKWVVRGVDYVDSKNRRIWFHAGGIYPDQDPYYIHYCRVNFDGTGLLILTEGDGTHSISYSPDKRFMIDTFSRVDMPPVTELRDVHNGKLITGLEKADIIDLEDAGWIPPERFTAKGRDGKTDIYGIIYRPTTFDPSKKYPVIESIYAGPQGSFVPKSFRSYFRQQSLAELGFIVVQIDGMGTSNRSKAFHDVCWKNLGDSGFPDRILWIKAAAKKYPYMDISRVGIYGGSAGGQSSTRALLAFGDFYKVAVSECGCHDNRMDKIWWNELWMGWPVGPHYKEQSNVTCAHNLKGDLFLIVGELDTNVDPASTMQVVNALIKADKDFDLLVVPGAGHCGSGRYGERRRRDFFVRHLLGVEPRSKP